MRDSSQTEVAPPTSIFRVLFLCLTLISIAMLCARLAGFVVPQPLIWTGWGVIDLKILLKLKELMDWFNTGRQGRSAYGQRLPMRPSPFVGLLLVESRVLRTFLASWKKVPSIPDGFTFCRGPEYLALRYILWFSILVEIPFMLFLANIVPALAAHRVPIEGGLALVTVYALVAFRADNHAIKNTAHRIASDGLHLAMGMRVEGLIPIENIHSIERISGGTWRGLSRQWRTSGLSVAKISALDKPNVVLRVSPGTAELHWMHGATSCPEVIGLYLDNAEQFVAELRARLLRLPARG